MMQHYVYKITNRTTGEYYYGKRTCSSDWRDDPYMGSGTLLKHKMNAHPDHDWHKEVLLLLDSDEEALKYEAISIGDRWDTDPLCLNLKPGGEGFPQEYWTDEMKQRASTISLEQWRDPAFKAKVSQQRKERWKDPHYRAKALPKGLVERRAAAQRRPDVKAKQRASQNAGYSTDLMLITRDGVEQYAPRGEVESWIRSGWSFGEGTLKLVHHLDHAAMIQVRLRSAEKFIRAGWSLGKHHLCKKITAKEAKRLSGLT